MSKVRSRFAGLALSTALVVGGLIAAPAAQAVEPSAPSGAPVSANASDVLQAFTPEQIGQAIEEAREGGYVAREATKADGSVITTLNLGKGFEFDLVQPAPESRLSAGNDSKGTYVAFNGTDQNMIISGATYGIGAALCVVSGGMFCVIAGAIITAATVAITSNGGVRCGGGKSLRVYPFAGGKVKPRCV